jgi:hypothetical protein
VYLLGVLFNLIFVIIKNKFCNMRNRFFLIFTMLFISYSTIRINATDYLPADVMEPWCGGPAYYNKWANGPSNSPSFFPITVWYQTPSSGYFYQQMGVNFQTYWGDPANTTESHLTQLKQYSMSGITGYTDMYLNSVNTSVVKGWFHPVDEPDNATMTNPNDPTGPKIATPPANIIADYNAIVAKDATRPVFINLGQGAAIDSWYGRGDRTYQPQDYIEYGKGADVISFDVYPMNMTPWVSGVDAAWKKTFKDELSGNIWYVAKGVDNLRKATDYKKPIWAFIECTNYDTDPACKLTPVETKAEVWMAIIHGARGIGYFCHILKPSIIQAGVLNNAAMKAEITSINATIKANATILNTQTVSNGATVSTGNSANPVDIMVKRHNGFTYIYAVSMRKGTPTATFTLRDFVGTSTVEVVGENRTITATNGVFQDAFTNWGVHIYKVATPGANAISAVKETNNFSINAIENGRKLAFSSNDVISSIELYHLSGKLISKHTVMSSNGTIALSAKMPAFFIAKAICKNKIVVQKVNSL